MNFLSKTIEYGLYLLVFLLPVQTRWIIKAGELNGGPWEYGTYSLYGTDILLILLLLLFIVKAVHSWIPAYAGMTKKEIAASPDYRLLAMADDGLSHRNDKVAYWFIGGLLLMSVIYVFFAASRLLALYKLGWLILGIGLFWLITRASYKRFKLIYAMLGGMFLQAVLGIWQFLSQSSFVNKWLGLAWHNAADLGASVVQAVGSDGIGERWLRAYGGLDHPNILGGILAVGVLLLVGEMIKADELSSKFLIFNFKFLNKFQISNFKFQINPIISQTNVFKAINWVFLIVFTAALFFSFSRAAWLGLAAGLAVMMALAVRVRNLKAQKGLAEIILVMGIILFILFGQYQNLITSRLSGQGRLENKSTSERLVSYQESWQIIKNNWLTGVGLGNYTLALSRQIPGEESFYYQPAHNVLLLVWAETGIIGLLFFIALLFAIAGRLVIKATRQSHEPVISTPSPRGEKSLILSIFTFKRFLPRLGGRGRNDKLMVARNENLVTILIALIVLLSFDHWLFSLHFGVLFFWLVLGVLASEKEKSLNPPNPPSAYSGQALC